LDSLPYGERMRRAVLALVLTTALVACSSGPKLQLHPTGPTAATGASPSASPSQEALPLRRGFLEIGTYQTEIFRPSFTIDIPVSSQWGTFGETGRKVFIGGPDGFFGITALSDSGPLTLAGLERAVHSAGVPSRPVNDAFIAGLQADQLNVTAGPKRFTIAFGGQHLRFSPHERATLWLVHVGTAPVLIVLDVGSSHSSEFRKQALMALRSVRFRDVG